MSSLAAEAEQKIEDAADAAGEMLDEAELGDGAGEMLAIGKALVGSLMARASDASLSDLARCARMREVAAASALRLNRALSLLQLPGGLQEKATTLREKVTEELVMRHVNETDTRVKALLSCKNRGPNEAELAHAWEVKQRQVKVEMQARLKDLETKAAAAEEMSDPFEKQLALNECRAERRAMAAAAKGCRDVGEKLNLVLDFLVDFQDQLSGISSKLDAVQGSVAALHDSLERKLGRPVRVYCSCFNWHTP